MKMIRYFLSFVIVTLAFTACEEEKNENNGRGESINDFKLTAPTNFSSLVLNPGNPDETVVIAWEAAKTGKGGVATYKFLLDKKDGDFKSPVFTIESDNDGTENQATLTVGDLLDAIDGANTEDFQWTVEATTSTDQGQNHVKALNAFSLSLKISDVSISPFEYSAPAANEKVFLDKIRTPNDEVSFIWTPATSADGDVTYTWLASSTPDGFNDPILSLESDNDGNDPSLTLTHAELTDMLSDVPYEDGIYWRVEANVGDLSYYPETRFVWFDIFDVPNLYIVGSFTNNWANNCTDAIQLTNKGGGVFESLITLPAGAEFKFVLNCGSWNVTWGNETDAAITTGTEYTQYSPGANVKVADAGSYFIRANFSTGKFKVTPFTPPANLYLVGGSTSAGWSPGSSVKFIETGTNKFEMFTYLETAGDGFKFLEVQDWAGDWGSVEGSRSVNDKGVITGELVQDGEQNVTVDANGFYRISVDYNTLKYTIEPAAFGIIGSARTGDDSGWGADDDMIFQGGKGSYLWTKTITLFNGKIKFRANDDWVINFGDDGANNTLEYGGADVNITAGTYVIELKLDPINGYTYTVTPQ